jgi:hypothetical protein
MITLESGLEKALVYLGMTDEQPAKHQGCMRQWSQGHELAHCTAAQEEPAPHQYQLNLSAKGLA